VAGDQAGLAEYIEHQFNVRAEKSIDSKKSICYKGVSRYPDIPATKKAPPTPESITEDQIIRTTYSGITI
jgi:hypothetical protein